MILTALAHDPCCCRNIPTSLPPRGPSCFGAGTRNCSPCEVIDPASWKLSGIPQKSPSISRLSHNQSTIIISLLTGEVSSSMAPGPRLGSCDLDNFPRKTSLVESLKEYVSGTVLVPTLLCGGSHIDDATDKDGLFARQETRVQRAPGNAGACASLSGRWATTPRFDHPPLVKLIVAFPMPQRPAPSPANLMHEVYPSL